MYIPEINLVIEYDGYYYHKNRYNKDLKWSNILKDKGYRILRIREKLVSIHGVDNYLKSKYSDNEMDNTIKYIYSYINRIYNMNLNELEIDFNRDKNKIYSIYSNVPKNSILNSCPNLLKEWSENNEILPQYVDIGSTLPVEWICEYGHTWSCEIRSRTKLKNPTGCPYCCRQKISKEDSILTTNPEIKSIFIDNNHKLEDIHRGSSKRIKIKCVNGHKDIRQVRHIIISPKCKICKINLLKNDKRKN